MGIKTKRWTAAPIEFVRHGFKFMFGPSDDGRHLCLWLWNQYYWELVISDCGETITDAQKAVGAKILEYKADALTK